MGKILQACYGIKGRAKQIAMARLADNLIAEGGRLVSIAAASKTFRNRTGNLLNSFGSTLYINGEEYTGPADLYSYWAKDGSGNWVSRSGFDPGATELEKRQGSDYARRYTKESDPLINSQGAYAEERDGARALDDFFDHYDAPKGKWQLIVVAALFYGGILEKKYNIKVISQIEGEMNTLASKYGGTVKTHDGYAAG